MTKIEKIIKKAKKRHPEYFGYMQYTPNTKQISSVLCKCCRTPLRALQATGEGRTYTEGGKVYIEKRVSLVTMAAYDSILIEFDDGSAHETPICKSCANKFRAGNYKMEELEDLYAADLEDFYLNGGISSWDKYINRKCTGVGK